MARIKIGWASRNVSTFKPVNIPGQFHMRIAQGVLDPVTVTALVLDDGQDQVIFLSADLVVVRSGLLDLIRTLVNWLEPKIPVQKILMNATHTHAGPSHYHDMGTSAATPFTIPHPGVEIASSDDYRSFLASQAASAIVDAWRKRAAGGLAYGYGYAVTAQNRRSVYFDDTSQRQGQKADGFRINGHAVMYGQTNDENFSHYEAGSDHFVNLLFTFDEQDRLSGAVVNLAAPAQVSSQEYRLSADFWHDVRLAIRAEYGDIQLLPQCAPAGDLAPRILHYQAAEKRRFALKYGQVSWQEANRKDIASRILASFSEVLAWAKKDIQTELELSHMVKTVHLQKREISAAEQQFAREKLEELEKINYRLAGASPIELLKENSQLDSQRRRLRRVLERYQDKEERLPMELHAVRLGQIAFVSNRFELYMDFMHRIQARSPFVQTFVIQLAATPGDDGGSYLATGRAQANRGYGASLFDNLVSPAGGQELVEESLACLEELAGRSCDQ